MGKGTPAFGRHNKTTHIRCRRCGRYSYHKTKGKCSKCGFPGSKLRKFAWAAKNFFSRNRNK